MEYHELIYISAATREMSHGDLTELLNQSREKNARLDITGLLLYHEHEFIQLLEGSQADIFSLYGTICQDDRNTQNKLLCQGPISQRSFLDWSMAFLTPNELSLSDKPGYSLFGQSQISKLVATSPQSMWKPIMLSLRDDFLRRD